MNEQVKLSDVFRDMCNAAGWPVDEEDLEELGNAKIRGYAIKEMSQADMVREIKKISKVYDFPMGEKDG